MSQKLNEHADTIGNCFDRHYRWGKHWGHILHEVGHDNTKFMASLGDDELPQLLAFLDAWQTRVEITIERRTPLTADDE